MRTNSTQLMRFIGKAAKWRIPGPWTKEERRIFLSFDTQTEGEWPMANMNLNESRGEERVVLGGASLPHKILLIEDDASYAEMLAYALEERGGCDVEVASDGFEAGNRMAQHSYDLVITDWKLPPFNGFSALRHADHDLAIDPMAPEAWFSDKKTPVIVVTACDAEEVGRERKLKGRFQFLGVVSKGQDIEGIIEQVELLYGNTPVTAHA
jgi:CheY-like chemotaxis protein